LALSTKEEYIAQCMASENKTREECEELWNQAQKTADQQTKEDYIKECVAGGKSQQECEDAWNEAHQTGDYASLIRRHEILKKRYDENIMYLKQATKIIKHFQEEKAARDLAEKHELAVQLEAKSKGGLKYKDLMNESSESLEKMRLAIDSSTPKNFTSVSALLAESDARKQPQLTVGEWDPVAKKYKGGR
jgi:hypothetical protein